MDLTGRKNEQDIVAAILNYAIEFDFDILVAVARKETYLQDFWTGSKVDRLATHLTQPLLVLND